MNLTVIEDDNRQREIGTGRFAKKKVSLTNLSTGIEYRFESMQDACKYLGFKSFGRFSQYLTGDLEWPKKKISILAKWEGHFIDKVNPKDATKDAWWSQKSENRFINSLPTVQHLRGYIKSLETRVIWESLDPLICHKAAKERLKRLNG